MTETSTNDPELLQTDSGSEECREFCVLQADCSQEGSSLYNLYERICNRDALI